MKIAVLSDIHGNLLALDAVMSDLEQQSVDEVWCGGDLGWGGPWAAECIARVRNAGWPTVRGNTDVWITGDPQTIEDPDQRTHLEDVARAHGISDDDARWLLDLPLGHSGSGSILLVHASPETAFDAPLPDEPAARFAPYAGKAALVVYAHVHRAFVRRLSDGTIVANTGAVGFPMDGDTASYLVIETQGAEYSLVHRRVRFDRRAGLAQAKELGDPIESLFRQGLGE